MSGPMQASKKDKMDEKADRFARIKMGMESTKNNDIMDPVSEKDHSWYEKQTAKPSQKLMEALFSRQMEYGKALSDSYNKIGGNAGVKNADLARRSDFTVFSSIGSALNDLRRNQSEDQQNATDARFREMMEERGMTESMNIARNIGNAEDMARYDSRSSDTKKRDAFNMRMFRKNLYANKTALGKKKKK